MISGWFLPGKPPVDCGPIDSELACSVGLSTRRHHGFAYDRISQLPIVSARPKKIEIGWTGILREDSTAVGIDQTLNNRIELTDVVWPVGFLKHPHEHGVDRERPVAVPTGRGMLADDGCDKGWNVRPPFTKRWNRDAKATERAWRSGRNALSLTNLSSGIFDAATMRTSTVIGLSAPSGVTSRASTT